MYRTCKRCNRQFQFDQAKGYSKYFCNPLCDGSHSGRQYAIKLVQEIVDDIEACLRMQSNPTASADVMEVVRSRLQKVIERLET